MKNIYIDFSVLAHRNFFSMQSTIKEFGTDILRHLFIKNIMSYINEFEPNRVYIAVDSGSSWRKNISSIYKGQRKAQREKQDVDWEGFYKIYREVVKELKENFPFYVLGIQGIEADDIIAHLVRKEDSDIDKIMITCDRDYVQLLQYPNAKLYDPIRNKFIKSVNPLHDLEIKICSGDKSDNIPSILPRWGEKTAEKKILSGELKSILESVDVNGDPCEAKKNYDRNRKLIDFTQIPKSILSQIQLEIDNYKISEVKGLMKYFTKYRLVELLSDIGRVRSLLKNLI
jgi:5'-3' exonuclease